ncbi:MAG: MCP four helix bundle domain-containing protein [Bryobacterales bacterium]|nr:MCP four helix bundle domain-containing protein [Bryobacterales bacterium]
MVRRSSFVLLGAFALLIGMMLVFGFAVMSVLERTEHEIEQIQQTTLQRERILKALEADVYTLAVAVRDHIIASTQGRSDVGLKRFQAFRQSAAKEIEDLQKLLGATEVASLRLELERYITLTEAVFEWSSRDKAARAVDYLNEELRPTRVGVLALAGRIGRMNTESLDSKQQEVLGLQRRTRVYLRSGLFAMLLLGLLIVGLTFRRVTALEAQAASQRALVEKHGEELRQLSHRLVLSQEEERRTLSRELHDQVGQLLTALRMELGNLNDLMHTDPMAFRSHLEEAKHLAGESLRSVRHLAMGLRPSLLDDLGLAAALRWQMREFSQRTGVSAEVEFSGDIDGIPEKERTFLFRIVQEAMTNCAKHAHAKSVRVQLARDSQLTMLQVRDDGRGFDTAASPREGIGLIGIEERVREIHGRLVVRSEPGRGTSLIVEIPERNGGGNHAQDHLDGGR